MKSTFLEKAVVALPFTIIALLFVTVAPRCCTRPDDATRLLQQQGFSNVEITGWRPFMAGKDDTVSTGFEATAPNGEQVSGAVTGGFFFKGSTVRFD